MQHLRKLLKLSNKANCEALAFQTESKQVMKQQTVEEYLNGVGSYCCISAYEKVENPQDWKNCPNCGLIPKAWVFDNGRFTGCGCGENQYHHFYVGAESVMSCVVNSDTGESAASYDGDALRKNWNHYCETGEILFKHASERTDGRW